MKNKKELEKILKALANKRRLEIIQYLKNNKEVSVGNIAGEINLSFRSTSKHLTVLSAANLVEKEQKGTQAFYKLSDAYKDTIKQIISVL